MAMLLDFQPSLKDGADTESCSEQIFDGSAECSPEALSGAFQREKMDAFIVEVGERVLSQSVVGQFPLIEVWSLRYLIGFKWNPKLAAEKFSRMVSYRVEHGLDNIRKRMEDVRSYLPLCVVTQLFPALFAPSTKY